MKRDKALDKLEALVNQIKENPKLDSDDKKEVVKEIDTWIKAIPEYFNSVINYECSFRIVSILSDFDSEKIETIDSRRRDKHIMATESINKLNRLCRAYNVQEVFPVCPEHGVELDSMNPNDRESAAEATFSFCREVFLDGQFFNEYNRDRQQSYHTSIQEMSEKSQSFHIHDIIEKEELPRKEKSHIDFDEER